MPRAWRSQCHGGIVQGATKYLASASPFCFWTVLLASRPGPLGIPIAARHLPSAPRRKLLCCCRVSGTPGAHVRLNEGVGGGGEAGNARFMRDEGFRVLSRLHGFRSIGALARLCVARQHASGVGGCRGEGARFFPRSVRCMQTAAGKVRWENYDPQAFSDYYWYRPFHVLYRAVVIVAEMFMLSFWQVAEKDVQKRAAKLRRSLIRLGPFYIKLGQALSTRPDLLPSAYCLELAKLQDRIPPFPSAQAVRFIQEQLGAPPSKFFADISVEPVAAASLGQVYKARLHSGERVAVKVQRPGMLVKLALDAHFLRLVGSRWQKFTGGRDIVPVVDEMVGRMFEEVDYIREGKNAERFASLYGVDDPNPKANGRRGSLRRKEGGVKVPKIFWDLTTKSVLTMEWIDGIKLTDKKTIAELKLEPEDLVDQGVLCSLKQLLEEGFFHADPHPGNLVVTQEGRLAYFDFGMMSELRREYRVGLIRTLVHYVNRDLVGLANDFIVLGFLPVGCEIEPIARALKQSLGQDGSTSNIDFQGIIAQLSDVMHQFDFRLPAQYAMVIRALGSLEGTATTLDPEFKVVSSAYPFIVGRLLADPDPEMRQILRELLICADGSIRWHRLERLVMAIAEEAVTQVTESEDSPKRKSSAGIRGAFDTRAVASAANDLLEYIFSPEGLRVRTCLAQDILRAFDSFFANFLEGYLHLERKLGEQVWASPTPEAKVRPAEDTTESAGASTVKSNGDWKDIFALPSVGRFWESSYWTNYWQSKLWGEGSEAQSKARKSHVKYGEKAKKLAPSSPEEFQTRLREGLSALARAVNHAPEAWAPLLLATAAKPEAQEFLASLVVAILENYRGRTSETTWLVLSKKLRDCNP